VWNIESSISVYSVKHMSAECGVWEKGVRVKEGGAGV
jgi:hypothetical protein